MRLQAIATGGEAYRERAVAAEALRRLVAPRHSTPMASAKRRVLQSLLETEWAPPDEDPRQNGQIAGQKTLSDGRFLKDVNVS